MEANEILRSLLTAKQHRNPMYSLRALARDLSLSAPFVSLLLSGKKKLSVQRAIQISQVMKLSRSDSERLTEAARSSATRSSRGRLGSKVAYLEVDQFRLLAQWYHLPILDLTTCDGFKPDTKWISRRLGITQLEAKDAVARLERLGLLRIEADGTWKKTDARIEVRPRRSESSIREFHRQMIEKASDCLLDASPDGFRRRDISGATFAANADRIDGAKKMIARFREELIAYLSEGPCTEVAQFNSQLFFLTEPLSVSKRKVKS